MKKKVVATSSVQVDEPVTVVAAAIQATLVEDSDEEGDDQDQDQEIEVTVTQEQPVVETVQAPVVAAAPVEESGKKKATKKK